MPMLLTQPHAGEIKSAEFHLYQLILAAGESARVELQADKAQLSLALLSTNNELIAATSESNAPGVQRLDIVAEDATTYLLRVTIERSQSTTAQYRLTLQDKHAATAVDRERFALHQLDTEIARLYQQRKTPALQQAAAKGREAGSRWLALNEWSRAGAVLSLTGQCYRLLDDFLHARQALTEALALQRRVGERQASVDTITELGLLHAHSGEYQEALDCFDEAYQLARATGFTEGVLASLDLLGVTCKYIGDFDKGRAVYQQLLDQAGKLPDRARTRYETQALIGLGIVARAKREYPLATDYLSRALKKRGS
ncbi:MAG: tetratricopeptide repeat protein [Blastocatellia bacterium]